MAVDYKEVDYNSLTEMYTALVFNWLAFIAIWLFWLYSFTFFCFLKNAPRFKQFTHKQIARLTAKRRSQSRRQQKNRHKLANSASSAAPAEQWNDNNPNKAGHTSAVSRSVDNNPPTRQRQESTLGAPLKQTTEEFQIQLCKIHRNLRILFLSSLTSTMIFVSYTCLNQTIIVFGPATGICFFNKIPSIFVSCQKMSLFTFFIARIYYSFGPTQYAVRPAVLILMEVVVVLLELFAIAFFFLIVASTCGDPDSLTMGAGVAVLCDFLLQLTLLSVFLSRLSSAIRAKNKLVSKAKTSQKDIFSALSKDSRSRSKSQHSVIKEAKRTYKFYYTIFKIFILFLFAVLMTWSALAVAALTSVFSAPTCYEGIFSNVMLYLSFQFNDNHYRVLCALCIRCQSCCLGKEYAHQMESNFVVSGQHRMGSRTFQEHTVLPSGTSQKLNVISEKPNADKFATTKSLRIQDQMKEDDEHEHSISHHSHSDTHSGRHSHDQNEKTDKHNRNNNNVDNISDHEVSQHSRNHTGDDYVRQKQNTSGSAAQNIPPQTPLTPKNEDEDENYNGMHNGAVNVGINVMHGNYPSTLPMTDTVVDADAVPDLAGDPSDSVHPNAIQELEQNETTTMLDRTHHNEKNMHGSDNTTDDAPTAAVTNLEIVTTTEADREQIEDGDEEEEEDAAQEQTAIV